MTQTEGAAVSAAHVAVAIVSAAKIVGVDPAKVFEPGRGHQRTLILAAAGVCARLGLSKAGAGKLFRVAPQRLAPSMLTKEKVTTEQLLEVAEALEAHGLTADDDARARFRSPWGPQPERRPDVWVKPKAAAPPVEAPAPSIVVARTPPAPSPVPGKPHAPRQALRTAPTSKGDALRRIPGLKPVSDDIARWSGYFVDAGWRLPTVADLFEVCPVALLDVLDPVEAGA